MPKFIDIGAGIWKVQVMFFLSHKAELECQINVQHVFTKNVEHVFTKNAQRVFTKNVLHAFTKNAQHVFTKSKFYVPRRGKLRTIKSMDRNTSLLNMGMSRATLPLP
jgi:hypothetical protein